MNLKNKMKQEISKFNLKIIEGEGHWLILHNPVALDKVLEEFLNEINKSNQVFRQYTHNSQIIYSRITKNTIAISIIIYIIRIFSKILKMII
jgi:hypothetical protein